MAKKVNVKLIMELRDAGLSRNMIAATRHMSKNSVGDVIHIADQKGSDDTQDRLKAKLVEAMLKFRFDR